MNDSYVVFDNVKKSYDGEIFVVDDFNLNVKKGEFVSMLGPSGSGKTTCLMMLAGFEKVSSGEIYLNGNAIKNIDPHKRNIGVVFQNYALFPHMSISENLAYPLKIKKIPKHTIKKRVNNTLELIELQDFKDRYPSQLSGGQKQRVALARALIYEPEIILMDEPLGALDKKLREQMQYEIKKLHKKIGFTVVYVTHDQVEALTMSDRIVVFNDGISQQIDKPKKLYEEPTNSFVANFMGENNKISGQIIDNKKEKNVLVASVKTSFGTVYANNVHALKVGEKSLLSLRPEKIILNPPKSLKFKNIFDAKIRDITYIGDHIRVALDIDNRKKSMGVIIAKYQINRTTTTLKEGDEIKISWHRYDCRALDHDKQLLE